METKRVNYKQLTIFGQIHWIYLIIHLYQ